MPTGVPLTSRFPCGVIEQNAIAIVIVAAVRVQVAETHHCFSRRGEDMWTLWFAPRAGYFCFKGSMNLLVWNT
jgi:hypothetical protein